MMPMTGASRDVDGKSSQTAAILCPVAARGGHVRKPENHLVAVEQRRARQRVDAAGEHQARAAGEDVVDAGVERLHAGGAVAHHGPARDLLPAAHAQRGDAADVHLVDRRRRAAEDHLVELIGGELLPRQQRAPRLRGEVGGGERPGAVLRLEERRARAVDYVDRLRDTCQAAFILTVAPCCSAASSARPKSCGKSSTLITCLRSASLRLH